MKKIVRIIIIIIILIFAILFALNEVIRVGNGSGESIGIIGKYFFEKSELSSQQRNKSDNYILWEHLRSMDSQLLRTMDLKKYAQK